MGNANEHTGMRDSLVQEIKNVIPEGSGIQVKVCCVVGLDGLEEDVLQLSEENGNVMTVYLGKLYDALQAGASTKNVAYGIAVKFLRSAGSMSALGVSLTDYSQVKGRLSAKLVNFEKSMAYLEGRVYVRFLDLALVYILLLCDDGQVATMVTVTDGLMRMWGVTQEEVHDDVIRNLRREAMDVTAIEYMPGVVRLENFMYVLTNKKEFYGAATIFLTDVLVDFSDSMQEGGDFFILPSSVHELLFVATDIDVMYLKEVVHEVNETLEPDEWLSGHVYRFCRRTATVRIEA